MSTPRLLSNRYELGETLGYGGMSEVHHGHDVRLGREVAIKILRADLARDPQFQERFRREAQNAAALNHPAIVAVYDTGETTTEFGPLPYIVMEFVEGRTLRDIVKTEGPMSQKRAMEVMADVSAALDFSHRHGIVHRDVKPANVMITKNGAVKVMDFGIARAMHDGQSAMTQTAAVIGTAQYLSPEQARGEAVDARSDVYAAGCVLYELITGEPPFTGDSPVAVAYQHVREDPKPPSSVNPAVSPELDAVVLKALSKGPANRYQSAAEMRSDLVRTLSGQRPSAPMVMSEDERTQVMNADRRVPQRYEEYPDEPDEDPAAKRRRRTLIGVLAGVLVLAAVLLIMWLSDAFKSTGETKTIPNDIVGQKAAIARQELRTAGFSNIGADKTQVCGAPDSSCSADQVGNVLAIDPKAGSQVDTTSPVTMTVGVSPQQTAVPDLKGMSVTEAQKALTDAHLTLNPVQPQQPVDDSTQIGLVQSQDPPAKQQVSQGTQVTITIGAPPTQKQVTNYIGQDVSVAKAGLQAAGFKVSVQTQPSDKPKNQVTDQNPNGGNLAPGSTVTLTVSDGSQDKITIPDVSGMTYDQAVAKLQSLGWTGNATEQSDRNGNGDPNTVTKTNPSIGTSISKTQSVTFFVVEGGGGITPPSTPIIPTGGVGHG